RLPPKTKHCMNSPRRVRFTTEEFSVDIQRLKQRLLELEAELSARTEQKSARRVVSFIPHMSVGLATTTHLVLPSMPTERPTLPVGRPLSISHLKMHFRRTLAVRAPTSGRMMSSSSS